MQNLFDLKTKQFFFVSIKANVFICLNSLDSITTNVLFNFLFSYLILSNSKPQSTVVLSKAERKKNFGNLILLMKIKM